MRAQRFILVLAVCWPVALPGACGGSTDSDLASDGGRDGPVDAPGEDAASDPATDGDAQPDTPDAGDHDADATLEADAFCACPADPPLTLGPCCISSTTQCSWCNAAKWELITAACKGGEWVVNMQQDTPCGTD